MSQKTIQGSKELGGKIKSRRTELGLTIEEAASKAGIGTKTWCRYEAGEAIRTDKAKSVCRALGWKALPNESGLEESSFDINEYLSHEAWSTEICNRFGEAAAISFVIGSDILLDTINGEMQELASMPRGSHVGELDRELCEILPKQFLTRYDYEFLYQLKSTVVFMRRIAHANGGLQVHTVLDEIVLELIVESAEFLMDSMVDEFDEAGIEDFDCWKEWVYDLAEDMDVVTFLYSGMCVSESNIYHFNHWTEEQFNV